MDPMTNNAQSSAAHRLTNTAIILMGIFILFISCNMKLDFDEMETLSASSFIFNGQIPYKDFWQMHTPLAYYFLTPLFWFFTSMNVCIAARLIMYLLLLTNGYLLFFIAERLFSRRAAVFTLLSYLV